MPRITAVKLGEILCEEFARDHWGDVDPSSFGSLASTTDEDHEMHGLLDVLERAAERINKELDNAV